MGSSDNSLESSSFGVKVNTYHNKRENAFIVVFSSLYIKHWICPRNVHLSDIKKFGGSDDGFVISGLRNYELKK